MNLIGIGTDIVEIERIARLLERQAERFTRRILHDNELAYFEKLMPEKQAAWLAKRFATKEALAKAFGTGIGQFVQWHEIETCHDAWGKPQLLLHGITQETAERLGVLNTALSLADERHYAVAFVILTG